MDRHTKARPGKRNSEELTADALEQQFIRLRTKMSLISSDFSENPEFSKEILDLKSSIAETKSRIANPCSDETVRARVRQRLPIILVVEDDENFALLTKESVEKAGAEAIIAHTLQEALLILDSFRIDMIITDFKLTDGNGTELARATKIPIIIVTGHEIEYLQKTGQICAGIVGIISKPVSLQELVDLIKNAMLTHVIL